MTGAMIITLKLFNRSDDVSIEQIFETGSNRSPSLDLGPRPYNRKLSRRKVRRYVKKHFHSSALVNE